MKTKFLILSVSFIAFFAINTFSQTWQAGSGTMYVNPTTTRLGLGTTTVDPNTMFDLISPVKNISMGFRARMSNFSSNNFSGNIEGRLLSIGDYIGQAQVYGVSGGLSNVSTLGSISSNPGYAVGGTFTVSLNNFTGNSTLTTSYVAGSISTLSGTITTQPANMKISAIIGRDLIKGANTTAGYFEGNVVVDGKFEADEIEVKNIVGNSIFNDNVGIGTGTTALTAPLTVNGKIVAVDIELLNNAKVAGLLTVKGKIEAEEIEVKNIAADFVFAKDYKLRSLAEVESFVNKNGHLPEVAPASETVKGVNLGEFNQTLLQKVEELTLYIIEQDKKMKELEEKINGAVK